MNSSNYLAKHRLKHQYQFFSLIRIPISKNINDSLLIRTL